MKLNVGVFVDGFRKPIPEGLKLAAEMKADSFQVYITGGDMLAASMSASARKDFVKRYRDLGLTLSATCGDFGLNFGNSDLMKAKEPLLIAAIRQTVDLGTTIMTTHIGAVGDDPDGSKERTMIDTLKRIGDIAAASGVTLATETGLESGKRLRGLLDAADSKGVGVNFDPANLVMRGFDHLQAVRDLYPHIVHTHAKDGVRVDGKAREVPLGEGGVSFPKYIELLTGLGYRGAFTIEREVGQDPAADIRKAIAFLRSME